jgi:hypothetical protein
VAERLAPFVLSVGSAPFIATFEALNYFPLGFTVSLSPRWQIRAGDGFVGFGLLTGLCGFHGRGTYAEADFYVVPIGADVSYGTLARGRLDFFLHGGGGPAVLIARPSSGGLLAKMIPYAIVGVGCEWSPFNFLAISLDASYTCFFDSSATIMGFTPSLLVELKL